MAAFTVTPRSNFVDWSSGKASMPATGTRYITISTGDMQAGGTEVLTTIAGSAVRPQLTSAMAAAVAGSATNSVAQISFTTSAVNGSPVVVSWIAIYDASTAGNLIATAAVTNKTITTGDALYIPISGLTIAAS